MRVIALIDGEHHPPVVRDALEHLAEEHELCGVVFVGGEEKVAAGVLDDPRSHYGTDVVQGSVDPAGALSRVAAEQECEAVFDLSGDPVLSWSRRLGLAALALHHGLEYRAPGLVLAPPPAARLEGDAPILSVVGTGKRTGKTAIAGHLAGLLKSRGLEPVVVAMGRGGPPEPTLVRPETIDRARLLEIARSGGHAASDYLEDAVLAGVTTIGCRRCGEGPAGEVFDSNVVTGAQLALSLDPDVVVLEGSGASLPPVAADGEVLLVGAPTADADALGGLGPYRLLRADLVVLVGADELTRETLADLKQELARWSGAAPIVGCALHLEPAETLPAGARVALFTTAPPGAEKTIRRRLAERGVEVELFSPNLARREALARDLDEAARHGCDLFLTELKAAAVEIVAERAERDGTRLVFCRNVPVSLPGEHDLDAALLALHERATTEVAGRRAVASRS